MPIPLPYNRLPLVRGVLVRGDRPVSAATVWWAGTGTGRGGQKSPEVCESTRPTVQTASDGAFTLPGERGFLLLVPLLPFHCMHRWNICVAEADQTRSVPMFSFYGICGAGGPQLVAATCDLDAEGGPTCTSTLPVE